MGFAIDAISGMSKASYNSGMKW